MNLLNIKKYQLNIIWELNIVTFDTVSNVTVSNPLILF